MSYAVNSTKSTYSQSSRVNREFTQPTPQLFPGDCMKHSKHYIDVYIKYCMFCTAHCDETYTNVDGFRSVQLK